MPRFSISRKQIYAKLHTLLKENDALDLEEALRTRIESQYDHVPFNMAARLVRAHAPQIVQFKRMFESAVRGTGVESKIPAIMAGMPLMIPVPKSATQPIEKVADLIRVYPNVPLDGFNDQELPKTSVYIHASVLNTFTEKYKADMQSIYDRQKWATPARTWTRIKRHEDVTIAVALTRYTNLVKMGYKANTIRDFAVGMAEQRRPMQLKYTSKAADMLEMYGTGPSSCMDARSHGTEKGWNNTIIKAGIHPTSFFHYHPYIKGVYSVNAKNTVVARTFLHEGSDGKTYFGRVYTSDNKSRDRFVESLVEAGYVDMGVTKYLRECTFTIPGVKVGSDWVMPLPYCDNLGDKLNVMFDSVSNEFIVTCGNPRLNVNVSYQSQAGTLYASAIRTCACATCGTRISGNAARIATDGTVFCSSNCALERKYCHAYRNDGTRVWNPKSISYYTPIDKEYYTTREAALKQGLLPVTDSIYCLEEEDDTSLSRQGYIIRAADDQLYRCVNVNMADVNKNGTVFMTGEYIFEVKSQQSVSGNFFVKLQRNVELSDDDLFIDAA